LIDKNLYKRKKNDYEKSHANLEREKKATDWLEIFFLFLKKKKIAWPESILSKVTRMQKCIAST